MAKNQKPALIEGIVIGKRPNKRRMLVRIIKDNPRVWYKKGEIHEVGQYTRDDYANSKLSYEKDRGFFGISVEDCEIIGLPNESKTTKVRIKPYRNGFRFEITYPNGEKPNHIYNTKAAAKKGLKALAEALTNYEIVK